MNKDNVVIVDLSIPSMEMKSSFYRLQNIAPTTTIYCYCWSLLTLRFYISHEVALQKTRADEYFIVNSQALFFSIFDVLYNT